MEAAHGQRRSVYGDAGGASHRIQRLLSIGLGFGGGERTVAVNLGPTSLIGLGIPDQDARSRVQWAFGPIEQRSVFAVGPLVRFRGPFAARPSETRCAPRLARLSVAARLGLLTRLGSTRSGFHGSQAATWAWAAISAQTRARDAPRRSGPSVRSDGSARGLLSESAAVSACLDFRAAAPWMSPWPGLSSSPSPHLSSPLLPRPNRGSRRFAPPWIFSPARALIEDERTTVERFLGGGSVPSRTRASRRRHGLSVCAFAHRRPDGDTLW
nr:unnamed protein product [Digitaria exilis]